MKPFGALFFFGQLQVWDHRGKKRHHDWFAQNARDKRAPLGPEPKLAGLVHVVQQVRDRESPLARKGCPRAKGLVLGKRLELSEFTAKIGQTASAHQTLHAKQRESFLRVDDAAKTPRRRWKLQMTKHRLQDVRQVFWRDNGPLHLAKTAVGKDRKLLVELLRLRPSSAPPKHLAVSIERSLGNKLLEHVTSSPRVAVKVQTRDDFACRHVVAPDMGEDLRLQAAFPRVLRVGPEIERRLLADARPRAQWAISPARRSPSTVPATACACAPRRGPS